MVFLEGLEAAVKTPEKEPEKPGAEPHGEIVRVRREWNNDQIASVPLTALSGFHWSSTGGGWRYRAMSSPFGGVSPRPFLAAYMNCLAAVEGGVAHSGFHGDCPHRIKIVVVAKDNPVPLMKMLKARYPERRLASVGEAKPIDDAPESPKKPGRRAVKRST